MFATSVTLSSEG